MKTASTLSLTQDEQSDAQELCISCLEPNKPGEHFCRHCRTPLSSFAATAPLESCFAEGDFWRKAIERTKGKTLRRALMLLFLASMVVSILGGFLLPR